MERRGRLPGLRPGTIKKHLERKRSLPLIELILIIELIRIIELIGIMELTRIIELFRIIELNQSIELIRMECRGRLPGLRPGKLSR